MSVTKITSLDQLHGLEIEHFSEVFVNNIGVIFQYAEKDISDTLDGKDDDTVLAIRQSLCNKVKNLFPEFSPRKPINRKAKHLAIQDIIYLSNSILRDNAVRDMEKVFLAKSPNDADAEPELMLIDFDAADPVSVASQLRVFCDEIKKLRGTLAKVLQKSCNCKCERTQVDLEVSPSTSETTVNNSDEPQAGTSGERPEDCANILEEDSSSNSDEDQDEGFTRPQNRKVNKRRQKSKQTVIVPTAAPSRSQIKAMYLGNVNPKCKVFDIKKHLEKNGIAITQKDISQLHHGDDYASFRISLPSSKYEKVSKIWSKGVKVRPYSERNGSNNSRHHRRPRNGNNFGNKAAVTPVTPRHSQEGIISDFGAGYQQAMQDARKHFIENSRTTPIPANRQPTWYYGPHRPLQNQPSPHLAPRANEWPPLPCVW